MNVCCFCLSSIHSYPLLVTVLWVSFGTHRFPVLGPCNSSEEWQWICIKPSPWARHWSKHFAYINSFNTYLNSMMEELLLSPFQRHVIQHKDKYILFSQAAEAGFTNPSIWHPVSWPTTTPLPWTRSWSRPGRSKHHIDLPPSVIDSERNILAVRGQACHISANPRSDASRIRKSFMFVFSEHEPETGKLWMSGNHHVDRSQMKPMQMRSKRRSWS